MDRNKIIQFPPKPTRAIVVQSRYDKFFIRQMRRALQDEFERYPEGLPTFHQLIIGAVERFAADVTNPSGLSQRDLGNFLSGMNSHTPRIAVLDAYFQITRPEIRARFFVRPYFEQVGSALGDFLGNAILSDQRHSDLIGALVDIYHIKYRDLPDGWVQPRFLAIFQESSNTYLRCVEFSADMDMNGSPIHQQSRNVYTGFCIPHEGSSIVVMRGLLSRERRVGQLRHGEKGSHEYEFMLATSASALADVKGRTVSDYEVEWYAAMMAGEDVGKYDPPKEGYEHWIRCFTGRVTNPKSIKVLREFVDNLAVII